MNIYRKICIILILGLTIYILSNLAEKRQHILQQIHTPKKEEFTLFTTAKSELEHCQSTLSTKVSLKSSSTQNQSLSLKEFVIKSSWNTARSGQFISTDTIQWVLSRGCRFLDFEVYSINQAPYVAYSTDSEYTTMTSQNQVLLSDVLRILVTHGFSGPCPNPQDPLFIHLRIKSKNTAIYNLIGMAIENTLTDRLYIGQVTGDTNLSQIMGKIVLICDQTIDPTYLNIQNYGSTCQTVLDPSMNCFSLSKYINVQSGNKTLSIFTASNLSGMLTTPIQTNESSQSTSSVQNWRLVVPDDSDSIINTNALPLVKNYGAQIIPNKFYTIDGQLH